MANGAVSSTGRTAGESRGAPARYVVVGAGAAGVIAAETLRRTDPGRRRRPGQRRERAAVRADGDPLRADRQDRRRRHVPAAGARITTSGSASAWSARRRRRSTRGAVRCGLQDGTVLPFDRLLIATGSRPTKEAMPGIDLPGVHTCWTLADARAILAAIKPGTRVVQMGAGFVGCIIMEGLVKRGADADGAGAQRPDGLAHDQPRRRRHDPALVRSQGRAHHAARRRRRASTRADGALAVTLTTGEQLARRPLSRRRRRQAQHRLAGRQRRRRSATASSSTSTWRPASRASTPPATSPTPSTA